MNTDNNMTDREPLKWLSEALSLLDNVKLCQNLTTQQREALEESVRDLVKLRRSIAEDNPMKFKKGDSVRVKSLEWYNNNLTWVRGEIPVVECGDLEFDELMSAECGEAATITEVNTEEGYYRLDRDHGQAKWNDLMLEEIQKGSQGSR